MGLAYKSILAGTEVASSRAAWLKARRDGIGSSDAPAIMGVSRFASPFSVYASKIIDIEEGEQTEAAHWGHVLEPIILREFGRETGRKVWLWGSLIASTVRPWQLATCDGIQSSEIGRTFVEVKNTSMYARWDDGPPADVWIQVQHQLAVTGLPWASVAVLFQGVRLRWADIQRDDTFIEELNARELEMWERMCSGNPPEPDAMPATSSALRRLYPEEDPGRRIALPGEAVGLDLQRSMLMSQISELEERKAGIDNRIRGWMENAAEGVLPSGAKYVMKTDKRGIRSLRRQEGRGL